MTMQHVLNRFLCGVGVLVMVVLVAISPTPVASQNTNNGVDLVFLIDNAYEQNPLGTTGPDTNAIYESARTTVNYFRDRIRLQGADEINTASVIRFKNGASEVLLPQTRLNDVSDDYLANVVPPSGAVCRLDGGGALAETCYTEFAAGFREASNQLASVGLGGGRTILFVLVTNSIYGNLGREGFTAFNNDVEAVQATVARYNNAQLYVYGVNTDTSAWNGSIAYWNFPQHIARNVPENQIAFDVLQKARPQLPRLGENVALGTITVPAYLESMSLFFFKSNPNQTIQFDYQGNLADISSIERESTPNLQVITIRNPRPGNWRISGVTSLDDDALELTQTEARYEQFMRVNNTNSAEAFINQEVELVWRAIGYNGTTINYGSDTYKPTFNTTVSAGTNTYTVPSSRWSSTEDGTYRARFYSLKAGDYIVNNGVRFGGDTLPTNDYNITLKLMDLVVAHNSANQFVAWDFNARFYEASTNNPITTTLVQRPTLEATLIYDGGKEFRLDDPSPVFNPAQNNFDIIPIALPFLTDFQLRVRVTAEDFNGENIPLTTRDPNGTRPVTMIADAGKVQFANPTARVLDVTQIQYRPLNITAQELQNRHNPSVIAIISETGDNPTTWSLPMTLTGTGESSLYVHDGFYPSLDVIHDLNIRIETRYEDNPLVIINHAANQSLDPKAITVRLDSGRVGQQFNVYTFSFQLLDGDAELTTPFTSGVMMTPRVEFTNHATIAPVPLREADIGRYVATGGEFQFVRSGDYPISVNFNIPKYSGGVGGSTTATLPLASLDPIRVNATPTNLRILSEGENVITSLALTPVTFTLQLNALDETFYNASQATLILSAQDDALSGEGNLRVQLDMNYQNGRYEATFTPVNYGIYTVQAQVIGSRFGTDPLITTADIGHVEWTVSPLVLDIRQPTGEYRQDEPIPVELVLGEDNFDVKRLGVSPTVTVAIYEANSTQPIVLPTALTSDGNRYRAQIESPSRRWAIGEYRVEVVANASNTNGQTSPLQQANAITNLRFNVAETQVVMLQVEGEADQPSTSFIPFSPRNPLVVRVSLDSINADLFAEGTTTGASRIENINPTTLFQASYQDWYQLSVLQDGQPIDPSLYVATPSEPDQNNLVTYTITGLPDNGNYQILVVLNPELDLGGVYTRGNERQTQASFDVRYTTNPLQTVLYGAIGVVVLGIVTTSALTWRKRERLYPPIGHLYLTDDMGRVFWIHNLVGTTTNTKTIARIEESWHRARINKIEVISNQKLKHGDSAEQVMIRMTVNGVQDPKGTVLNLNHPPTPFGDQRFKIGRSASPVTIHEIPDEIRRIKQHDQ